MLLSNKIICSEGGVEISDTKRQRESDKTAFSQKYPQKVLNFTSRLDILALKLQTSIKGMGAIITEIFYEQPLSHFNFIFIESDTECVITRNFCEISGLALFNYQPLKLIVV